MDRSDSYSNVITGLGSSHDKAAYSRFEADCYLDFATLGRIYEGDALGARIVDRVVDDAITGGWTVTGDVDLTQIRSDLQDLDATQEIGDAWRWARLYGGALLVLSVNDGRRMDQPLNLPTATKLQALNVIEAPYVTPEIFSPRMGARAFRDPEFYTIALPFGKDGALRRIHKSRVIRFDGMKIAPTRLVERGGWGPSVLDRVIADLSRLGQVMGYSASIMHDISVQVFKLKGFRDMLCGGPDQEAIARKVIESLRMGIDNNHALGLDTEDDYIERTRTATGLEKLTGQFVDALVRATDMPRTVVLGEQPSGLNAGADGEIRAWLDHVAAQQIKVLEPAISRLVEVQLQIAANTGGQEVPGTWRVEFDPLWRPTAKEAAETLARRAEALERLIVNDVITPDEARTMLLDAGMIDCEDA